MHHKLYERRVMRHMNAATTRTEALPEVVPPTKTVEEVWELPATGTQWCDCEEDHEVTKDVVEFFAYDEVGEADHITHALVVAIAVEMGQYESVFGFFHDAINRAASQVQGGVAATYPYRVGLAIVGLFCRTWNGCPEELCEAQHEGGE